MNILPSPLPFNEGKDREIWKKITMTDGVF